MLQLELYTTDHCSLCEEALDTLLGMPEVAGLSLSVIDIADDDALVAQYGEKIPVLRAVNTELSAPFDRRKILAWLDKLPRAREQDQ